MASPVWVDDITCTESESCFSTNCVNDDQSKVTAGPCTGHAMDVSISCSKYNTMQYIRYMYLCSVENGLS